MYVFTKIAPFTGLLAIAGLMPGIQGIGCTILDPVYRASRSVALAIFHQRLIHRNAFQPIVDRPPRMMLPLISNVVFHPLQILRPKADHTVSALPLENFISGRVLMIDLVRRCSFQFSDEFADRNRGQNCHADVDERFNSTDRMHENTGVLMSRCRKERRFAASTSGVRKGSLSFVCQTRWRLISL